MVFLPGRMAEVKGECGQAGGALGAARGGLGAAGGSHHLPPPPQGLSSAFRRHPRSPLQLGLLCDELRHLWSPASSCPISLNTPGICPTLVPGIHGALAVPSS